MTEKFKFKEREEPVFTQDPWYDLSDGGYIDPEDLLSDPAQAQKLNDAVALIQSFFRQAEAAEVIEYT